MSQENVKVVRTIVEAAERGDWEAALSAYDDGVVLDQSRMPGGGVYHGHAGVREFYRRWIAAWDSFRIEVERVIDAGEVVVDVNTVSGIGTESGAAVTMRTANVWHVEGGKVVRHVGYPDASMALEAAGLSE